MDNKDNHLWSAGVAVDNSHAMGKFEIVVSKATPDTPRIKLTHAAALARLSKLLYSLGKIGDDELRTAVRAIYAELDGAEEGFTLLEYWSRKVDHSRWSFIKAVWEESEFDREKLGLADLIQLCIAKGIDAIAICEEIEHESRQSDSQEHPVPDVVACTKVPVVVTELPTPIISAQVQRPGSSSVLNRYAINNMVADIEKRSVAATPLLGDIALHGQATAIYAPPNVGKSLIVLAECIASIKARLVDPSHVYYVNNDDTNIGLLEKTRIANEYGFNVISETYRNFDAKNLLDILGQLVERGEARGRIVILDTMTKFVDVMNARATRAFTKAIRHFVLQGGSVIALGHANKNLGADGKPVFRGTADVLNDFDCAYIAYVVQGDASERIVLFENRKRRGNVIQSVAYRYTAERGISYHALLASVEIVDPEDADLFQKKFAMRSDSELIALCSACIKEGIVTKMLLADAIADRAGISKRDAIQVIERYDGSDPEIHCWHHTVGVRGAKVFSLLGS